MKGKNSPLYLKAYTPLTHDLFLLSIEGKSIIGDAPDKAIYFVSNGTRRMFPDFDTFLAYNFTSSTTKHVKNKMMATIPLGDALTSVLEKIGPDATSSSSSSSSPTPVSGSGSGSSSSPTRGSGSGFGSSSIFQDFKLRDSLSPAVVSSSGSESFSLNVSVSVGVGSNISIVSSDSSSNSTSTSTSRNLAFLTNLKSSIESGVFFNVTCWGDDYTGSRDDFLNGKFSSLISTHPVLIYPMCIRLFQLGNSLGYYLNDIACAQASGSHFIAAGKHFTLIDIDSLASPYASHFAFFNALPTVINHPMALSNIESKVQTLHQIILQNVILY